MNEEKKTIYTVILGICMFICIILIGRMMLYTPAPLHSPYNKQKIETPKNKIDKESIILTEDKISEMINEQLPKDMPLKLNELDIKEDTIQFDAELEKKKLMKYLSDNGQELTAPIRSALLLVPDKFKMEAVFNVEIDKESGLLLLTPQKVKAGGVELPDSILIPTFFESINKAVNNALCESGLYFTDIKITEGAIELIP